MRTRIGEWEFDRSKYDPDADILYVSIGPPREGYGEETREGHFLRFDETGEFYGVTIIDAKRIWDEEGRICVTFPSAEKVELSPEQFELA